MKSKNITLLLSLAITACFFMPLFEWHDFEMSGMNYILSAHIPDHKYFLLLIPFSTVALFFGALNNENYLLSRNILSAIPFLVSIFSLLMKCLTYNSSYEGNVFSEVDLGFWMMLGSSLLLMFVKGKERIPQHY